MDLSMKKCSKCNIEKSFPNFYKRKDRKTGYISWCKNCIRINTKKWESTDIAKIKKRINNLRYSRSERYKLRRKRYNKTEIGKIKKREQNIKWRLSEKGKINKKKNSLKWSRTDRAKIGYKRRYIKIKNNPDEYLKMLLRSRKWSKNNPQKTRYYSAKYRTSKLLATPKWANLKEIEKFYLNCPQGYVVDHIIPLQGNNVSGLHVHTNLQYLTHSENVSKGNKYYG